jgi:hypothetical protein
MYTENTEKLEALAGQYGVEAEELLETYALDSVAPGICMNAGCDFSAEYEPDQQEGWCEECQTRSVTSCLVLLGVI